MSLENLVNVQGQLAQTAPQLDIATVQSAAQIMADRKEHTDLRNKWFWTADSNLYRVERDQAVLYLGGIDTNLVFKHLDEAVAQLLQTQNYHPSRQDINSVVASARQDKTLRVRLSDLNLTVENNEFCYYEIDTSNYANSVKDGGLNKAQRKTAEQVYGRGKKFAARMKDLNKAGISKTRIWVLNSEYVKSNVGENNGICRASRLGGFVIDSRFYAVVRNVVNSVGFLRGVRKVEAAEGSGAEKSTQEYTSQGILDYLAKNPIRDGNFAAALLSHANTFYNPKQ